MGQVRDDMLHVLASGPRSYTELIEKLARPDKTIYVTSKALREEGLIQKNQGKYELTAKGEAGLVTRLAISELSGLSLSSSGLGGDSDLVSRFESQEKNLLKQGMNPKIIETVKQATRTAVRVYSGEEEDGLPILARIAVKNSADEKKIHRNLREVTELMTKVNPGRWVLLVSFNPIDSLEKEESDEDYGRTLDDVTRGKERAARLRPILEFWQGRV